MESAFCNNIPDDCRLIETFGFFPDVGIRNLKLHFDRMCQSAKVLGISFDRRLCQSFCDAITSTVPLRCRLTLSTSGEFDLTTTPFQPITSLWELAIADQRLRSDDFWLGHKTTQRQIYDQARAALPNGIDEVLFFNQDDNLCEGTITNVFVHLENGQWVTPPVSHGCLPGVLRRQKIERGDVRVAPVSRDKLRKAQEIRVGNALRGEIKAKLNWTTRDMT